MAFLSSITFAQAKSKVARALGGQGDTNVLAVAGEAIVQAFSEWDMARDWNWMMTTAAAIPTVVDTQDYALPDDVKKIYDVRLGTANKRELYYVDEREYRRARWDQTVRGVPVWYTQIYSGTPLTNYIRLFPIPAVVDDLYVRYFKELTAPGVDADTLNIPRKYENGIIWLAKAFLMADRDAENARTNVWGVKAQAILVKAIAEDDRQPDRETRMIPAAEHMRGSYDPTHPYYYLEDFT